MNIQTLLVMGALIIMGSIILMVNNTLQGTSQRVTEGSRIVTALSIGEQVLNEIRSRQWDENASADTIAGSTNVFTAPGSLTHQAGEYYSGTGANGYDDINDYNGLDTTKTVDFGNGATEKYRIQVQVYYVSNTDFTTISATRTYNKRIIVKVKSPYLSNVDADSSVTLDYIASYQYLFGSLHVN